jgi:hypothetical protein
MGRLQEGEKREEKTIILYFNDDNYTPNAWFLDHYFYCTFDTIPVVVS